MPSKIALAGLSTFLGKCGQSSLCVLSRNMKFWKRNSTFLKSVTFSLSDKISVLWKFVNFFSCFFPGTPFFKSFNAWR